MDDLPEDPVADDAIQRLLSQYGNDDVVAKVYEQKSTGEEMFLYIIPQPTPEKVSEEAVRGMNKGRGGKFKLQFLVNGEVRATQLLFMADAPSLDPAASAPMAGGDPALLQRLLQKIESLETQIVQQRAGPREPILDMVEAMGRIQALQPKPAEFNPDSILKWIDFGKQLGGGGGTESWASVVKEIFKEAAPVIAPILMAASRNAAAQPQPNGQQLPAAQGGDPVLEEQMMRQGIVYLKKKCMMRSDPGIYLDFIIDNAEEFPYSRLVSVATTQEFSAFAGLDPELNTEPYKPWFLFIFDGLRSHFGGAHTVDADSSRTTGDANNPPNNGGSDKGGGG